MIGNRGRPKMPDSNVTLSASISLEPRRTTQISVGHSVRQTIGLAMAIPKPSERCPRYRPWIRAIIRRFVPALVPWLACVNGGRRPRHVVPRIHDLSSKPVRPWAIYRKGVSTWSPVLPLCGRVVCAFIDHPPFRRIISPGSTGRRKIIASVARTFEPCLASRSSVATPLLVLDYVGFRRGGKTRRLSAPS